MRYSFTVSTKILRNPLRYGIRHTLRRYEEGSSVLWGGEEFTDRLEDFFEKCEETPAEILEIWGLDQEEIALVLERIGAGVKELTLLLQDGDTAPLSFCTSLTKLSLIYGGQTLELWDVTKNTALEILSVEASDCTSLLGFERLAGSGIRELKLYSGGCSLLRPLAATVEDLSPLTKMPNLAKLELHLARGEDPISQLRVLATLTGLEELHLDEDAFSFAQFCWLAAKLPQVRGIGGISNFYPDRPRDTTMMKIDGWDVPDLDIDRENEIHERYAREKAAQAEQDTPPQ